MKTNRKNAARYLLPLSLYFLVSFYHLRQRLPDLNWDRANYADYIVFALLNNRTKMDWAPGGLNNFNNPLTSIPGYLFSLYHGIPGYLAVLVILLAIFHFANRIINDLFSEISVYQNNFVRAFAINIMLAGPLFFSEIGTTMGDWTAIPFFIASLSYFIRILQNHQTEKSIYISISFMSAMTFLKITNVVFLAALLIAIIFTRKNWQEFRSAFKFSTLGILTSSTIFGYWFYRIYSLTGNPVFPFWNEIFKSPYYPLENFRDMRWNLDSFSEGLMPLFGIWSRSTLEFWGYDVRATILTTLAMFISVTRIKKSSRIKVISNSNSQILPTDSTIKGLSIFLGASILLWATLLFYARYAMPLEIVSGLLLLILMTKLRIPDSKLMILYVGVFVLTFTSIVPNWNLYQFDQRKTQLNEKYFGDRRWQIEKSQLQEKNQTFVMLGMHLSYLIRSSDATNSFIRIEFYGQPTRIPLEFRDRLGSKRLFLLTNEDPNSQENATSQERILSTHNLVLDRARCNVHFSVSERFWICPFTKNALM